MYYLMDRYVVGDNMLKCNVLKPVSGTKPGGKNMQFNLQDGK